jgi:hypothetical protein
MKVESSFTIDGKVVEPTKMRVGEYFVYKFEEDFEYILYFVDKNLKVVSRMDIETDMGQGSGYISDARTIDY